MDDWTRRETVVAYCKSLGEDVREDYPFHDGNWEAMSGDIAFEPELQRCIGVDIRYVLFMIDKWGQCPRLIEELKLVK